MKSEQIKKSYNRISYDTLIQHKAKVNEAKKLEIQVDEITTTVQNVFENNAINQNTISQRELISNSKIDRVSLTKLDKEKNEIKKKESLESNKAKSYVINERINDFTNQSQNLDSTTSLKIFNKLNIREYYLKIYFDVNLNNKTNENVCDDTIDGYLEDEEENILNKVESFFYTNVLFFLNESLDLIRLLTSNSMKLNITTTFSLFEKFYDYFLKEGKIDSKEFKSVLTFLLDLIKNCTYMLPLFDASKKIIKDLNIEYSTKLWPRFLDRTEKILNNFTYCNGSVYAIDIDLLIVQILNTLFNLFTRNVLSYKLECNDSFNYLTMVSNYNTNDVFLKNVLIKFEKIILNEKNYEKSFKLMNNVKFIRICYLYQDIINYCILFYMNSDKTKMKLKEVVIKYNIFELLN